MQKGRQKASEEMNELKATLPFKTDNLRRLFSCVTDSDTENLQVGDTFYISGTGYKAVKLSDGWMVDKMRSVCDLKTA